MLKKISEFWISALFILFLLAGFMFYVTELFNLESFAERAEKHLLTIVIMVTSLITGSFVIGRLYINNQISIKEREMGDKFRRDIQDIMDRFSKEQDAKFAEQNAKIAEQNAKIAEQNINITAEIKRLLEINRELYRKVDKIP